MSLLVAVQMDPIERINIRGDSTFALLLEAQARPPAIKARMGATHFLMKTLPKVASETGP